MSATIRQRVAQMVQILQNDWRGNVNAREIADHLSRILAETEEPAGDVHVHGNTPEQSLRLSALSEAVTASASDMSTEEPDETVKRARAFYAFLAAEETADA